MLFISIGGQVMNKKTKIYNLQKLIDNQNWLKDQLANHPSDTLMVEHYQQMIDYYSKKVWGK